MPLGAFAALAFITNKIHDWMRELVPDKLEPKILVPISWAIGMLVTVAVCTVGAFAEAIEFGDYGSLASLGIGAQLIFGFGVGAGAGIVNDFKPNRLSSSQVQQAVDQADTIVVKTDLPAPLETAEPAKPRRRTTKRG